MAVISETKLLLEFMDGITKAIGGAWQMVHQHQDPRFLQIRQSLEGIRRCAWIIAFGKKKSAVPGLKV